MDIIERLKNKAKGIPLQEPVMPEEIAEFIETDFGRKVHDYYMAELEFVMCEGYEEWLEMLNEERAKVKKLEQQLSEITK